ncbi:MAG: nucleotidyltransferase domain-containing protein [Candidatus Hydrogenedentes bacterium]|nr:nucleotidyltransferase domain-containing protein [Candidatus Hydrogenedentota bacterium]
MRTLEESPALTRDYGKVASDVKHRLLEELPGAEVILYGSVSRGEEDEDSDIDLLVLTPSEVHWQEQWRIRGLFTDLSIESDLLISFQFMTKTFWEEHPNMPFIQEVRQDGVVI